MPICENCNNSFPSIIKINEKWRPLNKRKYCLECSPFGKHNTKTLGKNKEKDKRFIGISKNHKPYKERVFEDIKWETVQRKYNEGFSFTELPKIFGFSEKLLYKGIKRGLFNPIKNDLHTQRRSKKISDGLKESYKLGRAKGWQKYNSVANRSYPEDFFVKVLKKNELYDKYTIIEKLPVSKYVLDFVFTELKLNVEIDGEQHFRTKEAIQRDKTRNEFLIDNGWKVYRIRWKEMFANPKNEIDKFLNYLA